VPAIRLAEAATGICDLLWLVDMTSAEMAEMAPLLGRFGPVVDISDRDPARRTAAVGAYGPDGITTLLDASMVDLAIVAGDLGLAFHSPTCAASLTDKIAQRDALRGAGLDVPRCVALGAGPARDEVAAVVDAVGWPAVLKPRSAQGSRHTFFAKDPEEATRLLGDLGSSREEMVLEDYLLGDTARGGGPFADYVSVETIVASGQVSHVAITGRFPPAEGFRETGFFIPAALDESEEHGVLDQASRAIEALGVRTGCLHTEIKLTPDGPRVIEVNGRVGGGVPEMLQRAAGLPLLELVLRVALGEPLHVDGPVPMSGIGYRFFLQPPAIAATVGAIDGLDHLADQAGVDAISVHRGPGATLDWRDGSRCHIVAVAGTARDLDELVRIDRFLHDDVSVSYVELQR
jgi:biotin carboxylase